MVYEALRQLLAAALLLAAGALGQASLAGPGSARLFSVALLLGLLGLALGLTGRKPARPATLIGEPPPPAGQAHQLIALQAQLEHLPVAAWRLGEQGLQALSNRARRLGAPGGVRDKAALHALLAGASSSGPVLLDTERGSERWQLQRQQLTLDSQVQTLLVLVPLENELESESLQAWQQLVQILTHEIMNSLTPIKSLSQTALMLLDEPASAGNEGDLRTALAGIAHRSEGLSRFVRNYRRVSQWPAPRMAPLALQDFFQRLQQATAPAWAARGGRASFELTSPSLRLLADEAQLEQALLALLQNAAQATADLALPRLWVQARQGRGGRLQITVRDNGPGVPAGLERQIFLPFFSAREAIDGGQGIGLAVVRQLVHGMGGRVRHVRPLEGGAAFVLSF
ncbi:signal transduction histidine kinase [Paucibacter oligotrophus]|uniref:histidine kinase n=1 Tax=Roseateles oligotrophus TaxID=1769250 RepID=A0A840L728_9BURK|nr:ATP-binding protein [Roseateles oligotrophus]MBB4842593.1 signal transduction histidine kinase [Roseateles oligotrophus]